MPKRQPWHHGEWDKVRLIVLARDGYRCQIDGPYCTKVATEADHIVSPLDGGAWYDQANAQAACSTCNGAKGLADQHRRTHHHAARSKPSRDW